MEGISPPEPLRGVYSSAKDDETAMSNGAYLMTLTHQQVGVVAGDTVVGGKVLLLYDYVTNADSV